MVFQPLHLMQICLLLDGEMSLNCQSKLHDFTLTNKIADWQFS